MSNVFGVKIILQDKSFPVVENTAIGLYNVASENSEFRWIQNAISGVTTWKEGIIIKNGLKPFSIGIDIKRSGNISTPGKGSVSVKNTNQFWRIIDALGITFVGLRAEIYIFNNSTPVKLRQYICEKPIWDNKEFTIPFKGSQEARRVNLNGNNTSVCFGSFDYAKFKRTVDTYDETFYTNAYFTTLHSEVKIFPITSILSTIQYRCELYGYALGSPTDPVDCYVIESGGQIRQVTAWELFLADGKIYVDFTVRDVFMVELSVTGDDRTWVQFVKISREYIVDSWPCKDFLKAEGGAATETPELYSYDSDSDKFNRIADFGLTVKDSAEKNVLDIDGSQYSNDIDNIDSYVAKPITSLSLETAADLTAWNCNSINFAAYKFSSAYAVQYPLKLANGLYKPTSAGNLPNGLITIVNGNIVNPSYAYDKNHGTPAEFVPTLQIAEGSDLRLLYLKVIKFGLPAAPDNVDIESVHLGIKMNSYCSIATKPNDLGSSVFAIFKRYAYTKSTDMILDDKNVTIAEQDISGVNFDDISDQYYSSLPSTNNQNFYKEGSESGGNYSEVTGYTLFQITDNLDVYKTFVEGGLFFNRTFNPYPLSSAYTIDDFTNIYEVCIIFKLAQTSIKKEVFSPFSSRVFDNTFGGRKTSTALIELPKDILESICRLQKDDSGVEPTAGWGKGYASEPQVNTAQFDSFNLAYSVAGQFEDGMSDELKRSLCKNFNMANWQNNVGAECIGKLEAATPVYTVTLDSVMDRTKIKIIDMDESEIYIEPYVNYNKNSGSGEFDSQLKVTNAFASAYSPGYTTGISNEGQAQAVWQACHSLALKVHIVNEPPSDLTDLEWANGADADRIAADYLERWVNWQGKQEIEFPTHYNIAASWGEMTPINVVFSHLTNNVVKNCLVEEITIDPNPPYGEEIKALII